MRPKNINVAVRFDEATAAKMRAITAVTTDGNLSEALRLLVDRVVVIDAGHIREEGNRVGEVLADISANAVAA
jgi:hypothetical protein